MPCFWFESSLSAFIIKFRTRNEKSDPIFFWKSLFTIQIIISILGIENLTDYFGPQDVLENHFGLRDSTEAKTAQNWFSCLREPPDLFNRIPICFRLYFRTRENHQLRILYLIRRYNINWFLDNSFIFNLD
mgnify:FL=1